VYHVGFADLGHREVGILDVDYLRGHYGRPAVVDRTHEQAGIRKVDMLVDPAFFHAAHLGDLEQADHQSADATREIDALKLHSLVDIDRAVGGQLGAALRMAQEATLLVLAADCLATDAVQNAAAVLAALDRVESDHFELVAAGSRRWLDLLH